MGAQPSGWLPPTGMLSEQVLSDYCTVDRLLGAVGFYQQFAVSDMPGLGQAYEAWFTMSNLPVGTNMRGLLFGSAPVTYRLGGPAGAVSMVLSLYAVRSAFNPAVLTWAVAAGLVTSLIVSNTYTVAFPPGGMNDVSWTPRGLANRTPYVAASTVFGLRLSMVAVGGGSIWTEPLPVVPTPYGGIFAPGGWRLLVG